MARPTQDRMAVNRGLFADIYKDCCKNEAECKILDIIIAQFLLNEVFKGDEQTERAIAKVTGLSKSGVRVVQGRAMKKMKDSLAKGGIKKIEDVVDAGGRSSASAKGGSESVD